MAATYSVIKKTQEVLGKYVTKPPLTEKLLTKPPFRFLHDVVTAVIKSHGVLNGLFEEQEMHSDQVKDKDAKIKFLEKLIDTLSFALGGPPLAAKPSKIVSGQEAAKTNEMLQALGKLVSRKIDTSSAVKRVLNGEKPGSKSSSKKLDQGKSQSSRNKENIGSNKDENGHSSRRSSTGNAAGLERSKGKVSKSSRSSSKDDRVHDTIEEDHDQKVTETEHPEANGENGAQENGHVTSEVNGFDGSQDEATNSRPATSKKSSESSSRSGRPHTGYGKTRTANHLKEEDDGLVENVAVLGECGQQENEPEETKEEPKPIPKPTPAQQKRPGSAIKSARPRTSK